MISYRDRFGVILFAASIALPRAAVGRVARTTLDEIVEISSVIAVVEDVEVLQSEGVRVARGTVEHVMKGPPSLREVYYLAEHTWMCDIATAKVGERSLIFLVAPGAAEASPDERHFPAEIGGNAILRIVWSGRGRMPIRTIEGRGFVTLWDDVELPEGIERRAGPDSRYEFIRSASLQDVSAAIRGAMSASKAPQ